ncbi:LysR family transcriptional regulator [Photobacterium rosenbergii]|uniref:LysR family transcriptional regulator n=1 Tax=Photobacterium rosenbergii TaxID=294936 RepID=UPI001C98FC26|nr:LysR family transcriptional regulator [Photobacterium rosenbergii]MBY5946853.1 LysR family transcriptional regulator [Photobacterium rosenbergii]
MQLDNFDLNLLKVLVVLLQEKNTSKAAERLGISQPAVSRALVKIRSHFDDPLFIRQPRGLKLTPKAQGLEQELPKVLSQLASTLQGDDFKPSDLTGTFRIALHSYLSESHGYAIFQALTKDAPELDIEIHNYSAATVNQLTTQELDAGLSFYPTGVPKALRQVPIAETLIGAICKHSHELAGKTVPIASMLNYPITGLILPDLNNQYMLIQQLFPEGTILKPKLRSQYLNNVLRYINENNAVCICPKTSLASLSADDFSFIEFAGLEETLTMKISLTFNNNQFRSAKYLWLEKLLRSVFEESTNTQ